MTTILFWNINKKPLIPEIVELCHTEEVDVLILAESKLNSAELLTALNHYIQSEYVAFPNLNPRLSFYYRDFSYSLEPVADEGLVAIRRLISRHSQDLMIVALHLHSKRNYSEDDQKDEAVEASKLIQEVEARFGHTRTLVIGDFNMNPFEKGMVSSSGFHGVMTQEIAQKRSRTVNGKERFYFYNPMWGRMGDLNDSPPGTFYHRGTSISYFWNTFDQVLLRPELLPCFSQENLRVISDIGDKSLLKNGKISQEFSDHLPIIISLALERRNANGN